MMLFIYLILIGIGAGFLGSIVGIGGGIIVVPLLTLVLKIPIQNAIGTSLVAVMATSISASRFFLKKGLTNLKIGLTLEIFTTMGAIIGSILIAYIKSNVLFGLFGIMTLVSAYFSYKKNMPMQVKKNKKSIIDKDEKTATNAINDTSNISDMVTKKNQYSFYDSSIKEEVHYNVKNYPVGFSTSFVAGIMSGLLGIGGGFIKVPTMNILMNVPMKVATATSNFMIGITAVASSVIYLAKGLIIPDITAAIVIGILIGGTFGSFIAYKLKNKYIVILLIIVFVVFGINMILKAFGVNIF